MLFGEDFQESFDGVDDKESNFTPQERKKKRNYKRKSTEIKKEKNKIYFGKNTQKSIYEFLNSQDKAERAKLYEEVIFPSFEKLVENLINIHKFCSPEESYEELKNDCITFLFENMGKFDFNRGTNAFSYFNVLAKNWLIIKSKQRSQRTKNTLSIEANEVLDLSEEKIDISTLYSTQAPKISKEIENEKIDLIDLLHSIRNMTRSKNELNCINSIISIFQNIDNIDLLNKNAVFLYLREISGLNPKQLTLTIQIIKKYYKKAKLDQMRRHEINPR